MDVMYSVLFYASTSLQFMKKETSAWVFSYEFCKVFKNIYIVKRVQLAVSGMEMDMQ